MIYFCSNFKEAEKASRRIKNAAEFLFLDEIEDPRISAFLKSRGNFHHINKDTLISGKKDEFVSKATEVLVELNRNNYSRLWWGLAFTSKNPLDSSLLYRIINFLVFTEAVSNYLSGKYKELIIILGDRVVLAQSIFFLREKNLKFLSYARNKVSIIGALNLFFPLFITIAFFKSIFLKIYSNSFFHFKFPENEEYFVLQSLITTGSFNKNGYYDTYFGGLPKYLKERKVPVIVVGTIFYPFIKVMRKIRMASSEITIIPSMYFCSFFNLLACYVEALKKYFRPFLIRGLLSCNGYPIDVIVRKTEREECKKQAFFSNILPYYYMNSFAKHVKVKRFFYPFENRSWEKSSFMGLKSVQPQSEVFGYQHIAISPKLINYIFSADEARYYPFPDYLVTIGRYNKNLLDTNFAMAEENRIKVGCALRQEYLSGIKYVSKRPERTVKILYILASSDAEYVNAINFCEEMFLGADEYDITLRPHPTMPFERALAITSPKFKFKIDRGKPLSESLKDADIVLYSSSTACIEALALGIPIACVHLFDYISPDPISGFSEFKWDIYEAQDLRVALANIRSMPPDEYKLRQEKAIEYAKEYFYTVDEKNITAFIK